LLYPAELRAQHGNYSAAREQKSSFIGFMGDWRQWPGVADPNPAELKR
jgi:hypothetical protein